MADKAPPPPVAVRIVRPYDTEEDFLESELETVGKTSVILIGAHARPQGVILRFEVTLQGGQVVLRGEGRVLQHKESAFRGQAGLALRFTRLDPKSKALVDRAAAIREARLSGSMPPQPAPTPPESNPAIVIPESSSNPISIPDAEPTPPPLASTRPQAESRPPTRPPPVSEAPQANPLLAIPSFPPMAPPSNIPSGIPSRGPSGAPVAPNATVAPDAMLAHILTANTTPPPPDVKSALPTSRPPDANPDEAHSREEAKTRPGKVVHLLDGPLVEVDDAPSNVHATTTVAAPALKADDDDDDADAKEERAEAETPKPPTAKPEPAPAPAPEAPPAPAVAARSPSPPPPPMDPVPRSPAVGAAENTAVTRIADRDSLLARLRERRASISDADKTDILKKR